MNTGKFSDGFKRDAAAQITERGCPSKEISERLGVSAARALCMKAEVREGIAR